MKTLMLLLPLLALALGYTDLNDQYIIETMLMGKDDKARQETQDLTACLLDEGPCSEFNTNAKSHLAQAMVDGCADCDMVQKRGAAKLFKILKTDFPDMWNKFEKKYDASGTNYDKMVAKLAVYA